MVEARVYTGESLCVRRQLLRERAALLLGERAAVLVRRLEHGPARIAAGLELGLSRSVGGKAVWGRVVGEDARVGIGAKG